jgi:hypothetical protein
MPRIIVQRRREIAASFGPSACQMFVTSEGTIRIAAACAGLITILRRPIETVGRPSPITPFTKPARTKVAKMKARAGTSSADRFTISGFLNQAGRTPREALPLAAARLIYR